MTTVKAHSFPFLSSSNQAKNLIPHFSLLSYPTGKSMPTDPTEAASPTKLALL
jgi:hypothetical protein